MSTSAVTTKFRVVTQERFSSELLYHSFKEWKLIQLKSVVLLAICCQMEIDLHWEKCLRWANKAAVRPLARQDTVIGQYPQLDWQRAVNHPRAPQVSQQDTTQSTISTTNWPLLSSGRSWKVFSGLQCCRSQELIAEILGHCTKRHTLMWQLNLFAQHCLSACACMFARQKAKRSNKS